MSTAISYPFTAVPNTRLDYYYATAATRPPVQTAILLFLERAITGWHKSAIVIGVTELARRIRATRSATSKALKALAKAGEVCRGELTEQGYPLWLPDLTTETCDADTHPRVQADTPSPKAEPTPPTSSSPAKKKKKEKTQKDPPKPPAGGPKGVPEEHREEGGNDAVGEALSQLENIYPVGCTDRELALRRLAQWLTMVSLQDLLTTALRYSTAAPYHVPLECFLSPSCLPKWLSTEDNLATIEPPEPKPKQKPQKQRQPRQRRRKTRRHHHTTPAAQPHTPTPSPPQAPSPPDKEAVVWSVFAGSGGDIEKAIVTLCQFITRGHTDLTHAITGLAKWLPAVWKEAPSDEAQLRSIAQGALEDVLAQMSEPKTPGT